MNAVYAEQYQYGCGGCGFMSAGFSTNYIRWSNCLGNCLEIHSFLIYACQGFLDLYIFIFEIYILLYDTTSKL